jgi:hypothetical protein
MASIVGEYNNANNASGWTVTDKIFGYLDQAGNIYNKVRYPNTSTYDYAYQQQILAQQNGMFGLPKPMGFILLLGIVSLVGFGVYKIVN